MNRKNENNYYTDKLSIKSRLNNKHKDNSKDSIINDSQETIINKKEDFKKKKKKKKKN